MTLKADLCICLCIVCTWCSLARTRLPIFVFLSAFYTFARNSLISSGKSSVGIYALCLHCCLHCNHKILQAGVPFNGA